MSSAYRSISIHKSWYQFTGLHWQFEGDSAPTYFVDTRLSFGASESPEIFQHCTSVVCMMAYRGYCVIVYLDDFLVIEADEAQRLAAHTELLNLLEQLRCCINWNKVIQPS